MPKPPAHSGFLTHRRLMLPAITTVVIVLVVAGFILSLFAPFSCAEHDHAHLQRSDAQSVPTVLSQNDVSLYRNAFALQQQARFDDADAILSRVSDPLLQGVLLGERYLSRGNNPSFSEIALWLARYGDHPQAGELYRLARGRTPEDADFLTEPQFMVTLKGFGARQDKSMLGGEKHWVSGLVAYRRHDMNSAAGHFKALLNDSSKLTSADDRAASAFWAYRASALAGDTAEATKYLSLAASAPPGFYSILARQISGERQEKAKDNETSGNVEFLHKDSVRRAIALKAIGQDGLAEKELRALFLAGSAEDRSRLAELAQLLSLPGAQMRLAVAGAYDASRNNVLYPVPHWKPTLGYHVEPALLFAIMRQESGFNPHARSASGAVGVMQLMPATASAMARDARLKLSVEPAMSMTLGQHYLERLMDMSFINDNLVFLLAAYNAGPGSVAAWQRSLHGCEDPLLFIESIPNPQTRDYVERVMGNYWVYSSMLGGYDNISAQALAQGRWPLYERSEKQVAFMLSHLAGGTE